MVVHDLTVPARAPSGHRPADPGDRPVTADLGGVAATVVGYAVPALALPAPVVSGVAFAADRFVALACPAPLLGDGAHCHASMYSWSQVFADGPWIS